MKFEMASSEAVIIHAVRKYVAVGPYSFWIVTYIFLYRCVWVCVCMWVCVHVWACPCTTWCQVIQEAEVSWLCRWDSFVTVLSVTLPVQLCLPLIIPTLVLFNKELEWNCMEFQSFGNLKKKTEKTSGVITCSFCLPNHFFFLLIRSSLRCLYMI